MFNYFNAILYDISNSMSFFCMNIYNYIFFNQLEIICFKNSLLVSLNLCYNYLDSFGALKNSDLCKNRKNLKLYTK